MVSVDNVNDPDPTTRLRRFTRVARGALADTRPLRTPAYRRLWTAGVVTVVGAQLTVVAVPTQIFALTGSSAYVGLTGLFGLVPLVVFGLWGGAIADAVDRRTLLLVTGAGIAVMSLALWVIAASGVGNVWVVLVLFAVQTALLAINQPTRSAVIPRLVAPGAAARREHAQLHRLPARRVRRAAAGGRAHPGDRAAHPLPARRHRAARHAVGHLAAARDAARAASSGRRAGLRDVVAGFRYAALHKVLLVSFLADIIAMAFGMPRILFPEMAERTFGDPPGGGLALGLLFAAIPIGAVVGGLFSGWLTRIRRQGVAVLVSICVWGLGVAAVRAHQHAVARGAPAGDRRGGRPGQRRVPVVDAADRRHRRDARADAGRVHRRRRRWARGWPTSGTARRPQPSGRAWPLPRAVSP